MIHLSWLKRKWIRWFRKPSFPYNPTYISPNLFSIHQEILKRKKEKEQLREIKRKLHIELIDKVDSLYCIQYMPDRKQEWFIMRAAANKKAKGVRAIILPDELMRKAMFDRNKRFYIKTKLYKNFK